MENSELKHEIDELAELRADVLLLKKQLSRQERTLLPEVAKWFYGVCVILMVAYVSVGIYNGITLSNLDKNVALFLDTYQLIAE